MFALLTTSPLARTRAALFATALLIIWATVAAAEEGLREVGEIPFGESPLEVFLAAAFESPDELEKGETLPGRIEMLIEQLTKEDARARKAAATKLARIGIAARSALRVAASGDDVDLAKRAQAIIDGLPSPKHHVTDAMEQPLKFATVKLRLFPTKDDVKEVPQIVTTFTDEAGSLVVPEIARGDYQVTAYVAHPDYDLARMNVSRPASRLQLPLLPRKSELYQRAVKGMVVGHDGKPVPGAVVQCTTVRTPGEGLINGVYPRGDAVTDDKGGFSYYLVNQNRDHDRGEQNRDQERGELIPVNSRFQLTVGVPHDESFFPAAGMYSNQEPVEIQLPRATRFHRLRFESSGGGLVEDPKLLRYFRVQFETDQDGERALVPLESHVVTKGRKLIPGTYRATGFLNGATVNMRPLVVRDDSPEGLAFQLPPSSLYRGRVTDGSTGKPLADAFVMGWSSISRNNLALLTDDDWDLLGAVESDPPQDHPAMKRLREFYGVQMLVRTDDDGRFEISRRPDQQLYGLMAFDKDCVPLKKRLFNLKPGKHNIFEAGDFPLFPAAKVLVRPVVEGRRASVSPEWLLTAKDQPDWIERFRKVIKLRESEYEYVHWLKNNEVQPIYVPADVRLRLKFETPYEDAWAPKVFETPVQLKQGETLELGDIEFQPALPAIVRVLDKQGKPVEGVPVRRLHHSENAWCVAHNTDHEGKAFFYVHPNSTGQFRVSDIPGPRDVAMAKNLFADFEIREQASTAAFEITITDEQIELLLGKQKK